MYTNARMTCFFHSSGIFDGVLVTAGLLLELCNINANIIRYIYGVVVFFLRKIKGL
jgi:hypothetical protein